MPCDATENSYLDSVLAMIFKEEITACISTGIKKNYSLCQAPIPSIAVHISVVAWKIFLYPQIPQLRGIKQLYAAN